jgi:hypothetical protein
MIHTHMKIKWHKKENCKERREEDCQSQQWDLACVSWHLALWESSKELGQKSHITFFPQQPYLHVVIDIYSKFIWAVPQRNENVSAIIASLLQCFAVMGVPSKLKRDNGPAYTGCRFKQFCTEWNIVHVNGLIIHKARCWLTQARSHCWLQEKIKNNRVNSIKSYYLHLLTDHRETTLHN